MRTSSPGGQHVNRTEAAVQITHVPTGTVAIARKERSQHRNRSLALARLAAALDGREREAGRVAERERWSRHDALERGNPIRVLRGRAVQAADDIGQNGSLPPRHNCSYRLILDFRRRVNADIRVWVCGSPVSHVKFTIIADAYLRDLFGAIGRSAGDAASRATISSISLPKLIFSTAALRFSNGTPPSL